MIKKYASWILIIALAVFGFANSDTIDYLRVSKRLTLGTGSDSIIVSGGRVTSNSMWKVAGLMTDTNFVPGNIWQVSPSYTFSKYRKTSATIKMALDSLGTDSAVVYVNPGIYDERIIAKSRVTIIGESPERVKIERAEDTAVVYCYNVRNFALKNMTITNKYSTAIANRTTVKLYRCFVDSTALPEVFFENLEIYSTATTVDSTFAVIADSSSFDMRNCYLKIYQGNSGESSISANIKVMNYSHPVISNCFFYSQGAHSALKIINLTCRPVMYNCASDGYLISALPTSVTIRNWRNISKLGSVQVNEWLTTTGNITDANFLLR